MKQQENGLPKNEQSQNEQQKNEQLKAEQLKAEQLKAEQLNNQQTKKIQVTAPKKPLWLRILKLIGIVLASIVVLLLMVILILKIAEPFIFHTYYHDATREFKIAGLDEGLVVQGLTCTDRDGGYLESGYVPGAPTRIYRVNPDGDSYYVTVRLPDGSLCESHGGGIASCGDYVWMTGDDWNLIILSLTEIEEAANGEAVEAKAVAEVMTGTAFVYTDDTYLWVGEFYREQNYPTIEEHHMKTPSGEENRAILCGYRLNPERVEGFDCEKPECMVSLPDQVQGFARSESGRFVISSSYAVPPSHLGIYKDVLAEESKEYYQDTDILLYYLCQDTLEEEILLPPMSEDLDYFNKRVYIMYESATNKYIFGKLFNGSFVYSYPVE